MIKKFLGFVLMVSVIIINFSFIASQEAMAAALTGMTDTVSNLTTGALVNHTIVFTTPAGVVANTGTIVLTFDNGTDVTGIVQGDVQVWDVTTASVRATTSVVAAGSVITITNGATPIAATNSVRIKIGTNVVGGVHQITNGSVGITSLSINGNFGDTGALSMPIITDDVVNVTANVVAGLSFTLTPNDIYFGNLRTNGNCFAQDTDPGFVTCPTQTDTPSVSMTAATSSSTGYIITVQGATLTHGGDTITEIGGIATAPTPGFEQFGITLAVSGAGTGTASAPYATAGSYAYDGVTAPDEVASVAAATATNTYDVSYLANIAATTEVGTYTTAHTYVATANF